MIRERKRAQNIFTISVVRMNCCDDRVRVKISSGRDKVVILVVKEKKNNLIEKKNYYVKLLLPQ